MLYPYKKGKGFDMKKTILSLLCGTFLVAQSAQAGLNDAILAYDYGQYASALSEFTYLLDEGNPVAAYYMGRMYHLGQGVSKNIVTAKNLYQKAASVSYFPAMNYLGKILLDEGNYELALPLLQRSALAGESSSIYELGQFYSDGRFIEKNPVQAFKYYKIASFNGDMKAQYQMAKMFLEGRGTPQDHASALKWLTRSADQGYLLAQMDLAELYLNNRQLRNIPRAYSWYSIIAAYNSDEIGQKAAEKRDVLVKDKALKKNLSKIQKGIVNWKPIKQQESVPLEEKNEVESLIIDGFNDPATLQEIIFNEGFLPRSPESFGITFKMIDNVIANQNAQDLVEQIEKSQQSGQIGAYGYLGDLFKTRLNNMTEAFLWYKKGAEAGDIYAQYQLARMFCEGRGISQPDAASCYAWLEIVASQKDPVYNALAQKGLSMVNVQATSDEIKRGQELISELEKKLPEKIDKSKEDSFSLF